MEEIWLPIAGFEGKYEVSNTGLVRTLERSYVSGNGCIQMTTPKLLAFKKDKDGYLEVGIYRNNKQNFYRVHRLVCAAFHQNPHNKKLVNHKNGIKSCNESWNLEWSTHSENELHSFRVLGKRPSLTGLGKFGKKNAASKPLYQLDLNGNLIKEWESLSMAVSAGFDKKSIYQTVKGMQSNHKGFKWAR